MNDVQQASAQLLQRLTEGASVEGAALIRRDGMPMLFQFSRPVEQETLSAMGAAILAAAETALAGLDSDVGHVLVAAGQHQLVITGVDHELLLLALLHATDAAPPLQDLRAARDQLRELLVG